MEVSSDAVSDETTGGVYNLSSDLDEDEYNDCKQNFLKWNKDADKKSFEQRTMEAVEQLLGDKGSEVRYAKIL